MPKLLWSYTQLKFLKQEVLRFVHGTKNVLVDML